MGAVSDDKVIADLLRSNGVDERKVRMVECLLSNAPDITPDWWAIAPNEDAEGAAIKGGRRCAVYRHWDDWWVGFSPRNGQGASVEGSFGDWCQMAAGLIAAAAVRPTPVLAKHPEGK